MAPASAIPRDSGYKMASQAVITVTKPDVSKARMQNGDYYVYIRMPREKVAPVVIDLTKTVQQHVSQNDGPQNTAPVLHLLTLQLPARSNTILYARVSVL